MNPEAANERPVWHVGLGFLAASFLFAILVLVVRHSVCVPAIDANRAAERAKDLADIRATEVQMLDNLGWINPQRGIVRLPIDVAMQIAAQEWQNPAVARTNLIAREEKATAPAPVVPAKPNAFE
ncbi:MAG TPA: hypothetical protein VN784_11090 [Candidatus Limnocylindrales bacterium]|nr:hypothetical protein [Candidatus Limnocylindrales bacterium]